MKGKLTKIWLTCSWFALLAPSSPSSTQSTAFCEAEVIDAGLYLSTPPVSNPWELISIRPVGTDRNEFPWIWHDPLLGIKKVSHMRVTWPVKQVAVKLGDIVDGRTSTLRYTHWMCPVLQSASHKKTQILDLFYRYNFADCFSRYHSGAKGTRAAVSVETIPAQWTLIVLLTFEGCSMWTFCLNERVVQK